MRVAPAERSRWSRSGPSRPRAAWMHRRKPLRPLRHLPSQLCFRPHRPYYSRLRPRFMEGLEQWRRRREFGQHIHLVVGCLQLAPAPRRPGAGDWRIGIGGRWLFLRIHFGCHCDLGGDRIQFVLRQFHHHAKSDPMPDIGLKSGARNPTRSHGSENCRRAPRGPRRNQDLPGQPDSSAKRVSLAGFRTSTSQSEHHSSMSPCMSNRPQPLGFFRPTRWGLPLLLPAYHP